MKTCIVCKCKDQKATFHKFPSNENKRKLWLQRCNIKSTIPSYSYVCASHFSKDDYLNSRLRADAFPKVPEVSGEQIEPCHSHSESVTEEKSFSTPGLSQSTPANAPEKVQIVPSTLTSHDGDKSKISKPVTEEKSFSTLDSSQSTPPKATENVQVPRCTPTVTSHGGHTFKTSKRVLIPRSSESNPVQYIIISSLPADFSVGKPHSAKKQIWRPSNVGDMTVNHFSTSRQAQINLNTMKKRIAEQNKTVKCLKEKNRRLLARVNDLNRMMDISKKENMKSEQALQILKSCQSSVLGEMVAKTKKGTFSPEVRKFAATLQLYSPKAYEYVRRQFKNALPHPKSVSRWHRGTVVNKTPDLSDETSLAMLAETAVEEVYMDTVDEVTIMDNIT